MASKINSVFLPLDFAVEPGTGMSPIVLGGTRRDTEDLSSFFVSHANEVTKFDEFGFGFMFGAELVECLADGHELVIGIRGGNVELLNIHSLLVTAMAPAAFAASAVDENAAHGFGRRGEEVSAILELG